jgi:NitT/TauT family transport system substrate-binding protein
MKAKRQPRSESRRHPRAWALLWLCAAALLPACSKPPPSPARSPLRIALDLWPGYYPLVLAEERRFFADEGLAVELRLPQDTHRMIADFAARQHDAICASIGDVILATRVEPDVRMILTSDESSGADQILGRGPLREAAQIRGRRIGTTLGGFGEVFVRRFLDRHGLRPNEVSLVNADAAAVPGLLARGEIDLGHTWEPYAAQARARGFEVWFTSRETPGLILDGLLVHGALVHERETDLRALVRAWFRAVEWWRAHPAEGNALVERHLKLAAGSVSLDGITLHDRAANRRLFARGASPGLGAAIHEFVEYFLARGMLGRRLRPEDILEPRFLE